MVSPLDRKSYRASVRECTRVFATPGLVQLSGSRRTCSSVRSAFCLPALRISGNLYACNNSERYAHGCAWENVIRMCRIVECFPSCSWSFLVDFATWCLATTGCSVRGCIVVEIKFLDGEILPLSSNKFQPTSYRLCHLFFLFIKYNNQTNCNLQH